MSVQVETLRKLSTANVALERLTFCVTARMSVQVCARIETSRANGAVHVFLSAVITQMIFVRFFVQKIFLAVIALKTRSEIN
jgi:hypothetical protein